MEILKNIYDIIISNPIISGVASLITIGGFIIVIFKIFFKNGFSILKWLSNLLLKIVWGIGNWIRIIFTINKLDIRINILEKELAELKNKKPKEVEDEEYIKEKLANLEDYEKANLREFFDPEKMCIEKRTIEMPIDDSTVSGLLAQKILCTTSKSGKIEPSVGHLFNCSINPKFEKHIDPKILGLPMSEDECLKKRPLWAKKYELELLKEENLSLLKNMKF